MADHDARTRQLEETLAKGDLNGAFQQANALLRENPAHPVALRVLGQIRLFQGLWSEAQAFAAGALEVTPDDPAVLLLQARIHGAAGRSTQAIECCDRVLDAHPDDAAAALARASFLERAGRVSEAIGAIDRLDDDSPAVQALLARALLRSGDATRALEVATAAAGRTECGQRDRYRLHLLRAKVLDKLERYDDAMAAALEAKCIAMPQPYDPARFVRQIDDLIAAYAPDRVRRLRRTMSASKQHIFVAGMARSGTTLVEQILDAHPQATGVGELKEIDIFARRLQQTIGAWVPYPGCVEFIEHAQLDAMVRAYEQAIRNADFPDTAAYVNKNLHNVLHAGFIAQLFPASKIIFTHREPRDIAISCLMGAFRPEVHPYLFDLNHIAIAIQAVERLIEHWKSTLQVGMTDVRYEELVRDQSAQSRRLLDFCGLPWDDACLRFWESGRTVMTLAYDQVTRPMYDSSIDRWRHYAAYFPA